MDPKFKDSVIPDPKNNIFPSSEAMLAGQLAAEQTEPPPLTKTERRRLKRQEDKNAQRRPTGNAGTAVAGSSQPKKSGRTSPNSDAGTARAGNSQSPKQEEKSGRKIPTNGAGSAVAASSQTRQSPKKVVVGDEKPTKDAGTAVAGSSQPKKKEVVVLDDDHEVKKPSTGREGNILFRLEQSLQNYQAHVASLEAEENQATNDDASASSSNKRKHIDDENDVLRDEIGSPSPKRPRLEPIYDELEIIDPEAETQVFEEEVFENTKDPSPPPKKRKRVVDEDDHVEGEASAARPKKQHRGSTKTTIYCGVQSPALNDPPIQPKKGGYPAAGATVYHCPRCEVCLSRPDAVRRHFGNCIETNGNPDALRWADLTERTRTPAEILAEAKAGQKPASKKVSRAPTPAQKTAAPAATSSSPPPPSQSPGPVQEQKPSGPINATTWANLQAAKRKRAAEDEEEELDPTEGHQEQKRQKRAPVAKARVVKKAKKEPFDRFAEMKKVAAASPGGLYPRINPHPRFERPREPWESPAPGMMTEMDELFWQKQPGNTIPLAMELAIQRGEIFTIQK